MYVHVIVFYICLAEIVFTSYICYVNQNKFCNCQQDFCPFSLFIAAGVFFKVGLSLICRLIYQTPFLLTHFLPFFRFDSRKEEIVQ